MHLHRLHVLGALALTCSLPLACTSILGDFSVGAGESGGDGGPDGAGDGQAIDGTSGDGGNLDDGGDGASATDAATDADASDYAKLTCAEQGGAGARQHIGTLSMNGNNGNGSGVEIYAIGTSSQQKFRILAAEFNQPLVHAFTFTPSNGGSPVTDAPLNGYLVSTARYATGVVAIANVYGPSDGGGFNGPSLTLVKLDDSASAWKTVYTLGGLPSCTDRLNASLAVIDAASDDYLVVLTYSTNSGGCADGGAVQSYLYGAHVNGPAPMLNAWPLPASAVSDAGPANVGVSDGTIAIDGNNVYAVISTGDGPSPGIPPSIYTTTRGMANPTAVPLQLADPNDILFITSLTARPAPGTVGAGMLEANLQSSSAQPTMYVGEVPGSKVPTLKAADLPATAFAGISDLVVDQARYHWEAFGAPVSDNFVGVGRMYPTGVGANFLWWDGQGRLRGQSTNATALLKNEAIYAADIAFQSAPFTAIASLELAFLKDSADAGGVVDVWATQVNCVK